MKKVFSVLIVAMAVVAMSCGGNANKPADQVDGAQVETPAAPAVEAPKACPGDSTCCGGDSTKCAEKAAAAAAAATTTPAPKK